MLNRLQGSRDVLVTDEDLVEFCGIKSAASLAHHVSKLRDEGHVILRRQEQGYVYQGRVHRPSTVDDAVSAEVYRPAHVGDPLLDALIRVHGRDRVQRDVVT